MKDTHLARLSDGDLICGLLKISYPNFQSLDLYDDCVFIDSFAISNNCGSFRKIQEVVHVMFQRGVAEKQGAACGPRWSSCA